MEKHVRIKNNLLESLLDEGIELELSQRMANKFVNTIQKAYDIWTDDYSKKWVTIDLCVEIPMECCDFID